MRKSFWLVGAGLLVGGVALQLDFGQDGAGVRPGSPPPSDPPLTRPRSTVSPALRATDRRLEAILSAPSLAADWASVLDEVLPPGTPETVSLLRRLVERYPAPEIAQQVFRALESLGGVEAVRALYEIGRERQDLTTGAAVRLSRVRGRAAAPALLEIIRDRTAPDEFVAAALRCLGHTTLRHPVDEIRAIAIDTKRPLGVRVAAVEALGSIADPVALPGLISLLKSPQRLLRRQAIRSVGRIRASESIAALEDVVRTGPNDQERLMAREALARLRGEPLLRW